MKRTVAIIGGGVIGTTTAIELSRLGFDVTVLDRGEPGGSQAASFGNGGWLCPASIVPVATLSLLLRLPSFLFGKSAPLGGNLGFALRNAGYFARFAASGLTQGRVARKAAALSSLLSDSADRHLALACQAGLEHLIRKDGLLYSYHSEAAFRREQGWWRLRGGLGVKWRFLDAATLRREEPGIERECFGAVLVEDGGHCLDPSGYVRGLAAHARTLGVRFVEAEVLRLHHDGGRLTGIETADGVLGFGAAMICCGARSRALALQAGDDPPLLGERGYHVTVAGAPQLRRPVMFDDALMVATPMLAGTRLAGQVEIAPPDAPPDWSRAETLLDLARRYLPALPAAVGDPSVSLWMGHRPAIADELPVIGRATGVENLHFAFGHGYTGLGAAPATARLAAQSLQDNRPPGSGLSPFSPQRFRARRPGTPKGARHG